VEFAHNLSDLATTISFHRVIKFAFKLVTLINVKTKAFPRENIKLRTQAKLMKERDSANGF